MFKVDEDFLNSNEKSRKVKSIDGTIAQMSKRKMVGYCHYIGHTGYVDIDNMVKHNCILKECRHFEKFEQYPYFQIQEVIAKEKACRKAKAKIKADAERQKRDELKELLEEARRIADAFGYSIKITSIRQKSRGAYIVFYLSDERRNDWYEYLDLSSALCDIHGKFFELRHIVNLNGEYSDFSDMRKIHSS